jgi:hypothetical protein
VVSDPRSRDRLVPQIVCKSMQVLGGLVGLKARFVHAGSRGADDGGNSVLSGYASACHYG